jgi:hypothetical protein
MDKDFPPGASGCLLAAPDFSSAIPGGLIRAAEARAFDTIER